MNITDNFQKLKNIETIKGICYGADNSESPCEDTIIHEHFLHLEIKDLPGEEFSCTASTLKEMLIGRLYTSGIIDSLNDIESLVVNETGDSAIIELSNIADLSKAKSDMEERINNRFGAISDQKINIEIDKEAVFALADFFKKDSKLHIATSGTHSAYLRAPSGEIRGFEDISRHNALDKAIGYMLLNEYDPSACMIYSTGRVPTDMVEKILMSKIPVLLSKSVPTDAALLLARKYGLTVLCRTWPDSYVIYN